MGKSRTKFYALDNRFATKGKKALKQSKTKEQEEKHDDWKFRQVSTAKK